MLTAWSAAGIFGPVLVNYIREYNVTHGVPKAQAYNVTMYIMAGLLVIGFFCNFFIKAVSSRYHMKDEAEDAAAAVAALGQAHAQEGDTVQAASEATGLPADKLNEIVNHIGGEGSLGQFASILASEGGLSGVLSKFI